MGSVIGRAQGYLRRLLMPLGFEFYLRMDDRRVLEKIILPYFQRRDDTGRVLFVGCDWYTRHYESMFPACDYWTLERDPSRARFGARQHITADLAGLGEHFENASLDLIVCNGVIGWGLNEPLAIEAAMSACVGALAPGGALILGWNDIPEKMPVPLRDIKALGVLEVFPPPFQDEIKTATYNHHTFKVLRRPVF